MRAVNRAIWGRPTSQPRALESRRARRVYDQIAEKLGPATFWWEDQGSGPGEPLSGPGSGPGRQTEKASDFNAGPGGPGGPGTKIAAAEKKVVASFSQPWGSGQTKQTPLSHAHGPHLYPDHPDHPDQGNSDKGLPRSGWADGAGTTRTTGPTWTTLDDWRRRLKDCANVATRREIVADWVRAAGGSVEGDIVTLPLGLHRGLALAELKTQAMIAGLKLVERAMDCAWCPNSALPDDRLCEHCRWLAGAQR